MVPLLAVIKQTVTYRLKETKEHVRVNGPLVSLVQHDDRVLGQVAVDQTLSQHHAVRHVLDDSLRTRAVLKPDRVSDLVMGHSGD